MTRKSLLVRVGLPILFPGVFLVASCSRNSGPPYEAGIHNLVVEAQSNPEAGGGPHIGDCPVFPKDNVWNTRIDKLPKDSHSDAYIASIGYDKKMHPDFASVLKYGIPYSEVPPGTPPAQVTFGYHNDSDLGTYPIPDNVPIEGDGIATGDRHIILIDPRRCILYELWAATKLGDREWHAGSGVKFDLTSNALRAAGKGSADAAGLPIFPGLIRYDEVQSGEIRHALRFTIPKTQAAFIWPARHLASRNNDPNVAPMGARFRLRADFDISKFSRSNQVILTALKRYGMFLSDNGGPLFISGVSDKRWNDLDLHKLNQVSADDFEVVDESQWQMLPDSGRVDPLAVSH